jgi:hypothetical protein
MSKTLIVALAFLLVLVSGGIYSAQADSGRQVLSQPYSGQADCGREGLSQSDLQECGLDTIR